LPTDEFLQQLSVVTKKYGTKLILDEVQSGYGRTGKFFAHQWAGIKPDIITMAKGMGNGFPVGGILISPEFEAKKGMLGTTFGGNYLAMAAAIAVADIIRDEKLMENVQKVGEYLKQNIPASPLIKEVRGKGLMLGIEFNEPVADIRKKLLFEKHIFTGVAGKNMVRLLAPLVLSLDEASVFIEALTDILNSK
jgi:acetylornithine aminotransferase